MPKDPINAFYKQSIEGLEEEDTDTIMARPRELKAIYNSLFRAFGFKATEGTCPDVILTLHDRLSRTDLPLVKGTERHIYNYTKPKQHLQYY